MKKYAILLKTIVSASLIAFLIWKIDFTPLKQGISSVKPSFYAFAAFLWCINIAVQAAILRILLVAKSIKADMASIIKMLLISTFFGVFLPGGTGPDIVLCYYLCKGHEKKKEALSAVLFSRLGATFIMVVIAFLFSFGNTPLRQTLNLTSAAMLIAGLAVYLVVIRSAASAAQVQDGKGLRKYKWSAFIYDTLLTTTDFMRNGRILAMTLPLFVAIGALRVLIDYSIGLSIGVNVPLADFTMMIPWPTLAVILPITIAGIGVRELAYVSFLAMVGVTSAQAFSISVLSFALTIVTCIVGAVIYAFNRKQLIK